MKEILRRYFSYQFQYETKIQGYTAYQEANGFVIVVPADYLDENVITEQYMITDFIQKSGFKNVAVPVYSNTGTFIVPINEESSVFICRAEPISGANDYGQLISFLQSFHHIGHSFPYTPLYINRYGQWKTNWEQIIDQFDMIRESFIEKDFLTEWERLWLESGFYFIGLGENAIQYLQESEKEKQYNQFDQPVFTFERITPFPHQDAIVPDRIVHDHPTRDLAELIRHIILKEGRKGFASVSGILQKYQQNRPLSLFGWRLLYSRLLFPIHFIDYSSRVLSQLKEVETDYKQLQDFLSYQTEYEFCMKLFCKEVYSHFQIDLPKIEWIY